MLFHTPLFALVLLAAIVGFSITQGDARKWVLVVASVAFYAFGGPLDTALFAVLIVAVYYLSIKLAEKPSPRGLALILTLLFGNLAWFKYGDFFYDNLAALLGFLDLPLTVSRPLLWLPLGISFYTFQMAAYVIDIYRGVIAPEKKLLTFVLFVIFFGQLVAGPIMRAQDFLPQLQKRLATSYADVRAGAYLIMRGLIKKIVIADRLAVLVDARFGEMALLDHASAWVALYFFAFQVYFDFSGYTDMGVGLGRIFGLRLLPNFNTPYLAANVAEFWRRWHITLSTWLRDYLYIPLGGNRCSRRRRNFNLFLTMLLGGLWHGAAWTFVIWGAFQGLWLVLYRLWSEVVMRRYPAWDVPRWVNVLLTFHMQCLSYVFFRSEGLAGAWAMLRQVLDLTQVATWNAQIAYVGIVFLLFLLHLGEKYVDDHYRVLLASWQGVPAPLRGVAYVLVSLLLILSFRPAQPFIYFRF
ncbi:MAG: MBOAT family protein [Firmicutes bacterium]|nr:MBOAT family protein [Dethiobacter sp.]MBS3888116.1 MBOAT family protein [Bacillota bacterium]MBS4054202.1 MBOAT family protein [Thermaerobacter sp.]MBS4054560.1 MBOAT family protein [Thermaerobacter sp.]